MQDHTYIADGGLDHGGCRQEKAPQTVRKHGHHGLVLAGFKSGQEDIGFKSDYMDPVNSRPPAGEDDGLGFGDGGLKAWLKA